MLRLIIIIFAINLVLVGYVLSSRKSIKVKTIWSTILMLIPLIGIAVYYLMNKRGNKDPFKSWGEK